MARAGMALQGNGERWRVTRKNGGRRGGMKKRRGDFVIWHFELN
jgi:hypothetical protein